jgi:hypothetical protein
VEDTLSLFFFRCWHHERWYPFLSKFSLPMCNYFCTCATLHTPLYFPFLSKSFSALTTSVYNMCVGYIITSLLIVYSKREYRHSSSHKINCRLLLQLVARHSIIPAASAVRLVFCTINGSISISRLSTPLSTDVASYFTKAKAENDGERRKSSLANWTGWVENARTILLLRMSFGLIYTHLWPFSWIVYLG